MELDKATSTSPAICMEITDQRIRLLQFDGAKNNVFELRLFAEISIPEGLIQNGVIMDSMKVSLLVVDALEHSKPKRPSTTDVLCLIPQQYNFFFTLDLPDLPREELRAVITRQVDEILPMPTSEVYWDWHRIGEINGKMRTQLAAVPRNIIDSYMQMLNLAKLTPLFLIPREIAAASLVSTIDPSLVEQCMMIDVSSQSFIVSVIQNSDVTFTSEVQIKKISDKDNAQLLYNQLRDLSRYCFAEGVELSKVQILVHGNTPGVDMLLKLFGDKGLNITRINYKIEDATAKQYLKEEVKDEYIPLMGGAVRGIGRGFATNSSINLVPDTAKKAYRMRQITQVLKSYLGFMLVNTSILLLVVVALGVWTGLQLDGSKARYEAITNLSNSPRMNQIEASIKSLNDTTQQVEGLIDNTFNWMVVVEDLEKITPNNVTLETVLAEPPLTNPNAAFLVLTITGKSTDRSSVLTLVDKMRSSKLYTEVKLPLDSLEESIDVAFTIEAQLPFKTLLSTNDEEAN